jgi:ubiquinone/menaquinone biosynthesis C-methylase UbiE
MTTATERNYLPAASHDWALPLYDPLVRLLGGDATRQVLLEQAALQPGHRVLDIGCGTGTLLVLLKQLYPAVEACGLDPDPKALARAARKAERAGVPVALDRGFSEELPYPNASFDRVLSSFMFHHLAQGTRLPTLKEILRVLRPGGSFHMVDFAGRDRDGAGRVLHSSPRLADNSTNRVLLLMAQSGLRQPVKVGEGAMLFGLLRVNYYRAGA